jgi:hypothetical protein
MKQILIKTCKDCPCFYYNFLDYDMRCFINIQYIEEAYNMDCTITIPDWCPLESYKEDKNETIKNYY